jgi:hypothetical protein
MIKLNREQRVALKKVFDRAPLYRSSDGPIARYPCLKWGLRNPDYQMTYKEFRKRVQPGFDCVMVKWCGMWLGIEQDGYTHS